MVKIAAICAVTLVIAVALIFFRHDAGTLLQDLGDHFVIAVKRFANWAGRLFEAPGL